MHSYLFDDISRSAAGEIALMEVNNRRTANVISVDSVSCLTLARTDFNRLLASLKVKLLEASGRSANNNAGGKGANSDLLQTSSLANKRRISTFNTHGRRDENRVSNLFKRFAKFTTEALWMSLYSRMYREMVLDPSKQIDYGVVAETVMRENDQRFGAVQVSFWGFPKYDEYDGCCVKTGRKFVDARSPDVFPTTTPLKDYFTQSAPFSPLFLTPYRPSQRRPSASWRWIRRGAP
jgi:hypothetical protein